jgi:hypothetical protein
MPQEFKVKNGLLVDQGGANITGSSAISGALSIASSGSNLFTVDGALGRLFSVDDSLSGSLFSVNTIAGLPVMEAFSDNTVRIGQYGRRGLYVSQSSVGIGKEGPLNASLDVSGSAAITGSLRVSLESSASGIFRVSSGSNTLLNLNSPGRLWLGNGAFVDAGYQADIQGSTRITGKLETYGTYFYGNTGVYLAPTMSGSGAIYQTLTAVTVAPTFLNNSGFGSYNTAIDITNGNVRLINSGAFYVGSINDDDNVAVTKQYSILGLGWRNVFMMSRSGSLGMGSQVGGSGGVGGLIGSEYYSNPRSVFIGHGVGTSAAANNDDSVSIGYSAGANAYVVNIGSYAAGSGASYQRHSSVNIGYRAGYYLGTPAYNGNGSVSIGYEAGASGSTVATVAIGYRAGFTGSDPNRLISIANPASVFLGNQAGYSEQNPSRLYIANSSTTSPLIGGDFFSGSVGINMRISDISASLHIKGTGATSASNALIVDNSNLTDLLRISNNGQQFVTSPLMTLSSSNAAYLVSQSLAHSGSVRFANLYGVNITPSFINTTSSQTQTALRVSALFTGSFSGSNTNNVIVDFGTQNSGSMFVIDDVLSGSVYTVNDFFGLPVLEVTSDSQVNMYDYPYAVFNKSASFVSLGLPQTFAVDSAVYLRADTVIDEGLGFNTRIGQGNGTTLNDSTASLYTYTFASNTGSAFVSAIVTGYDSASRATVSGEIKSTVKCLAGVASIIGTNFRYLNAENSTINIDLTVSSNTFSVRAYGTGSRTYVWATTVTTQTM